MDSSISPRTKPLYRGTQIVWYILGIIETLLLIRFALKLLGANASAGFTSLIYSVTYPFTAPFMGVFKTSRIVEGSTFEWTTLLAMLVYWLLAIAIIKLFLMGRSVSTPEAATKMDEQEK
ncbi:MAG: hypothetical protein A3G52_02415 [Candidatus Taylorbacteria bacterium RIFCSPLOWO2_12_FULL_43_20]|uniref:YggT family protein n=1 Tax=Candidatus Taylorbacteria bacterium RIFCSPLOWO2_12_FULL_43_20 TaxID=1802332 RepID=A0A1G2P2P6_9BACT|nr:MAG: hypothetical protein A3E92_01715 [Candidatus Taylorbacteria bacterium RIFCSPHIGHO2_12_FULL_42_34]OHA37891.1 MAG: hypothetical protein A3H58_00385 [Candidatus Taylorbacteria bacterium RIFCSPLOWO2_02_FULL_43_22b]OHA42543.1 MAG: hypothetical protein A3G52_02415 [Candidatus Taylorbacteria bacterium RIFCSPLOWO2_12_FULL_43_20]